MALQIIQRPLYGQTGPNAGMPVGQQILFSVLDADAVANYFNVKYSARVFVYGHSSGLLVGDSIGTFETTPNNAGAGIWDFRPILETFVRPDNIAPPDIYGSSAYNKYKTVNIPNIPIHLIDQFSANERNVRKFGILFSVSGSSTATGPIILIDTKSSMEYNIFNGVLQYDDTLRLFNHRYGYELAEAQAYPNTPIGLYGGGSNTAGQKILSNAPTTQYANIDDYGTIACLSFLQSFNNLSGLGKILIKAYNSSGVFQASFDMTQPHTTAQAWRSEYNIIYAGVFPGNIRNRSSAFDTLITSGAIDGGYYTVQAQTISAPTNSALYTIHLNCPTNLGYEPIRLTWLNQWGVWDYYTFTQKSVKSISTKRAPYNQISGTWNEETITISGYQGGRKNFRVNTSEKIKMNTGYVTEEEGHWFEELINSPEVYILNGYDGTEGGINDPGYTRITNKYVEPVTLTTSSYTRKTIANDKLMQYTFEVEKSKNRRTQSV